jgi:hypothetical protein
MRILLASGVIAALIGFNPLLAQTAFPVAEAERAEPEILPYVCPMDPDVRAKNQGKCSKCGMDLVLGLPHHVEYPVRLTIDPTAIEAGKDVELQFRIFDPATGKLETHFNVVHEKIFHLLYISHDLETFGHVHPEFDGEGVFRLKHAFPKPGAYRLLADFFPQHGTPQMIPLTVITKGFDRSLAASFLDRDIDLEPKKGPNLAVALRTEPEEPIAAMKTMLFFTLDTNEGLEKFLGAWAHMLAASADTIDLIHAHPAIADGGTQIQINVIFPRPGMYRLWIQTQREGVVNTAPFTLRVKGLQ